MSDDHQIDRENCYICSRSNPDVLERHHIVPRRHGGSDEPENLVDLCPTCHSALETLYDERFYRILGIDEHSEDTVENNEPDQSETEWTDEDTMACIIGEVQENGDCEVGAPIDAILNRADDHGFNQNKAKDLIEKLWMTAEIYTPYTDPDIYRVVE